MCACVCVCAAYMLVCTKMPTCGGHEGTLVCTDSSDMQRETGQRQLPPFPNLSPLSRLGDQPHATGSHTLQNKVTLLQKASTTFSGRGNRALRNICSRRHITKPQSCRRMQATSNMTLLVTSLLWSYGVKE